MLYWFSLLPCCLLQLQLYTTLLYGYSLKLTTLSPICQSGSFSSLFCSLSIYTDMLYLVIFTVTLILSLTVIILLNTKEANYGIIYLMI